MNDIKFVLGEGGLKTPLPNEDHKSGMLFLRSYPAAGSPDATPFTIDTVLDLPDAVGKGITEAAYPEEYYQIKTFFDRQPNSTLVVGFGAAEEAGYDFHEITDIQNFANGSLRQIQVITYSAFVDTNIPLLQTVADALFVVHKPVSILFGADMSAMDLSALLTIREKLSPNVSAVIGMDGTGAGKALFDLGKIVPAMGAALATISLSAVNESIADVGKYNVVKNNEFDVPAFANGDLVSATGDTLLNQLNDFGYVFLRKHVGITGTYWNENSTCDLITSDYAFINNVRTIDKATRVVRAYTLPKLNSPLTLTGDGKLSLETIVDLKNTAGRGLEEMYKNGEISGYAVVINANQDIAATSKVLMNITLVIRGIARNFDITIGYGSI